MARPTIPTTAPLPKTAVIGASGFIGGSLLRAYRAVHPDCVGTARSPGRCDLLPFDLRQPDLSPLQLEATGHQAVLIAGAETDMLLCEQQPQVTSAVNVQGTLELVRQIGRTSMQVIFLSTDFVFDGQAGGYDDDAVPHPRSQYGRQKAAVEREIPPLAPHHLILRLSHVFGTAKGDRTYLGSMAAALAAGNEYRGAVDQVFCPTCIDDVVRWVPEVQRRGLGGTLNVCNPERWSRLALAQELARALGVDPALATPASLHDFSGLSNWPLDTTMVCSRFAAEVGGAFTPVRQSIQQLADNWRAP
jgi:dTDP-4-dehydrorhamnose reductase